MSWYIENGQTVEDALSSYYDPEDLKVGMQVQILSGSGTSGRLMQATVVRVHRCWHDYRPIGYKDPNGKQWTQSRGTRGEFGKVTTTHYMWTLSDDAQPVTDECRHYGAGHQATCVHVRYGNGRRVVAPSLPQIRPMNNAIERLADVAGDDA